MAWSNKLRTALMIGIGAFILIVVTRFSQGVRLTEAVVTGIITAVGLVIGSFLAMKVVRTDNSDKRSD